MKSLSLLLATLVALLPAWAAGQTLVRVAAASDLVFVLDALGEAWRQSNPEVRLEVATGSSGSFHAQILEGAPFDVFLSADEAYPRALIDAGAAEASTLTPYAVGRLVIWTLREDLPLDRGIAVVADPSVRRIAIANPDFAPYGRAARQALESASLWESTAPRRLVAENISQTAHYVRSGNADVGIVALSLVRSPRLAGVGQWRLVDDALHQPLLQAAVLTRRGSANAAARGFIEFLVTPAAREVFRANGFTLPGEEG